MNQSHQSHHSRTGLTRHLLYDYDAFSSFYFSFFFRSESDCIDESDKSYGGRSGSEFTFGPCFLHFDVELYSDQIISI